MATSRYPEIAVSGRPRELGQQLGESCKDLIRGFCEVALDRVNKTIAVSQERAYQVARESRQFAENYRPDLVEELQGTADGCGLTIDDLMLLQVRNQLQAEKAGGCTSISVAAAPGVRSGSIVAQTWDNDPALDEFTIVLTRRPDGKPAQMCCTQAGLISYMGFSETQIGTCVNTLPAPAREVGVPHYFILRELYEATSLRGVIDSIERADRAIPVNIMLSTPDGPADIEATLDRVLVLKPKPKQTAVTHTNHCLSQELLSVNAQFPELAQSHSRQGRIDKLIARNPSDLDLDGIKSLLSDHDNFPTSICRHASNDPVTGFWETVFAIIIEPEQQAMHVSRGNPCQNEFETYQLAPN